jgi:hypothetical protein
MIVSGKYRGKRTTWLLAAVINLVIFLVFSLLSHPVYNSLEDMYVVYRLAGGYGDPPTELLDFNLGLHPYLNWIIKSLFTIYDGLNWYTLFLFFAHYIFCTIILAYLMQRKPSVFNYVTYLALLFIFEGYFLLFPDFTGASMTLTAAGILLLLTRAWHDDLRLRHYIAAVLLLLFASFFRIVPMFILPGIALPFIILTVSPALRVKLLAALAAAAMLILLFNFIHTSYYKSRQPGWANQESYRQKMIRFFNNAAALERPLPGEKWYEESGLIMAGAILDTSFLTGQELDRMYSELKAKRTATRTLSGDWQKSRDWRKWFFINNRLFLALAIFILVVYGYRRKIRLPAFLSCVLLLMGLAYLFYAHKIEPYILVSSLSLICFAVFLFPENNSIPHNKRWQYVVLVLSLAFLAWGLLRAVKTTGRNKSATAEFQKQYAELAAHSDFLFVHINGFAIRKMYAWDPPARYPLPNFLQAERFSGHNFRTTLSRFQIEDVKSLLFSPKVLFWGKPPDGLKPYFEKIAGKPLQFSAPLKEFKEGIVWKIE